MAFIPRESKIGKEVQLLTDVKTLSGTFTAGHRFKVIAEGARGFDLEDADGNRILETSFIRKAYEFTDKIDEEHRIKARALGITIEQLGDV